MLAVESGQDIRRARVRVYIDGFNLYHAADRIGDSRLKWLNLWALSKTFLRSGEDLDQVNFYTAVLHWDQGKQQRHRNFIAACKSVGVRVHEGNFKRAQKMCSACGQRLRLYEEKQTDVAIAVHLTADALTGQFDRAILVTADSDQIPMARHVLGIPDRSLTLVFPPGRKSVARELSSIITDNVEMTIGRMLTCLLPRSVVDHEGKVVATMPAIYQPAQP